MPIAKGEHTDIVWARVDSVVNLLLENPRYCQAKRTGELTETVMKQFGVAQRTAEKYTSLAKRELRKITENCKRQAFERAMIDREFLLQRAKGMKDASGDWVLMPDYKFYHEVVKDRDKLNGLYVDELRSESTVKNIDLSKFSEYGLSRIARGDKIEEIMIDPKSIKLEQRDA